MRPTALRFGQTSVVRIGHMFSRPVVVIPLLAVPLIAGGLHALATGATDVAVGDYHTTPAAASSDPFAEARASLDRAQLPLGMLESGFGELTDGAAELDDGAAEMGSGLTRAREGGTELANGLDRLDAGLGELGDGSARLNEGVSALVGALSGAAAVQGQVVQILSDTIADLSTVDNEAARRSVDQLTALRDVVQSNGMQDLPARLEELRAGSQEITYQLDDPQSPFAGGVNRAADGSAQLRDGLVALDDGGRRLTDGTNELVTRVDPVEGVLASLSSALADARAALPEPDSAAATASGSTATDSTTAVAVNPAARSLFPVAVLILIGSTLAAAMGRRSGPHALLPAALTAACGWITLAGSGWADTGAGLAAAAGVIVLATATITATTGALIGAIGRTRGRWCAAVLVLIQVLIAAIATAGDERAAHILAAFTPIGWVTAGLTAVVEQAPLRELAVPVLVLGTALAIGLSILAAARSAEEQQQVSESGPETEPSQQDSPLRDADSQPAATQEEGAEIDDLDTTTADAVALVSAGRAPAIEAPDRDADADGGVDSNSDRPV